MDDEQKANRITAYDKGFEEEDRGTSFHQLLQSGRVANPYEYYQQIEYLMSLHHHDCDNATGRCHKRRDRESGEMVCRVPHQMGFAQATFVPVDVSRVFDDESATTVRELTQDKYLTKDHRDQLQFSHGEAAGRWQYQSREEKGSTAIATVPKVAVFMKSATNVAKVDPKFGPGYGTKYVAGSDEKQKVQFHGKDPAAVESEDKPLENIKITGQRIISEEESKKNTGPLIRRVAYTDICFDMLKLPYVRSSEDFRHYSNKYPEHRHAVRKYGRTSKSHGEIFK